MFNKAVIFVCFLWCVVDCADLKPGEVPEYIKQCKENDPNLIECLMGSLEHLRPYLARGIPEIELPSVEPFQIDELRLSLGNGPNGYKVKLSDLDVHDASNFTVSKLKLSNGKEPFEATIKIPALRINAKYTSSGVLIILPASGNGTFHAIFDDVTAVVKGKISSSEKKGLHYLNLDKLNVNLGIKNVKMQVRKVFNNNKILIQATNLFLRENGHEVLKAMMPQLRQRLNTLFLGIVNQLLKHVPREIFLIPTNNV